MKIKRWGAGTAVAALAGSLGWSVTAASTPPGSDPPSETGGVGGDTVWRETFDGDTSSWSIDTAGAVGDSYAGWTMVDREQWMGDARPGDVGCDPEANAAAEPLDERCFLDGRNGFTRADGVLAVADNGLLGRLGGSVAPDEHVVSTLSTPAVDVAGHEQLELAFDLHFHQGHKTVTSVAASIDGGEPVEVLRFSAARRSVNGGGDWFSAQPTTTIDVPSGAESLVLSFTFDGERTDGYVAIDDVLLRTPLAPLAADTLSTDLHVISDIQVEGLPYVTGALELMHEQAPEAAAMLLVGDIISGPREATAAEQAAEYELVTEQFAAGPLAPVVVSAIGNHDRGRELRRPRQVVVISHHVLPWTVSGTYGNFYADDFGDGLPSLLAVLGAHPNVILFTAHSHWNPRHHDWAVREVVAGGDPDGFTVVNTGALAMEFAPSPTDPWDEDSLTDRPESPSATVVNVYADRTVIRAFDVLTGEQINETTVPNALA